MRIQTKCAHVVFVLHMVFFFVAKLCFAATTYYVSSSDGSDSYNGLSGTVDGGGVGPWASLKKAAESLGDDNKLLLKCGDTWKVTKRARKTDASSRPGDGFVVGVGLIFSTYHGTEWNNITVGAYYGDSIEGVSGTRPIIDASDNCCSVGVAGQSDVSHDPDGGAWIKSVSWYAPIQFGGYGNSGGTNCLVENVILKGPYMGPILNNAYGCTNLEVNNVHLMGRGYSAGIYTDREAAVWTNRPTVLHDSFFDFDNTEFGESYYGKAVEMQSSSSFKFRDNVVNGVAGRALHWAGCWTGDATDNIVERNYYFNVFPTNASNSYLNHVRQQNSECGGGHGYVFRNNVVDMRGTSYSAGSLRAFGTQFYVTTYAEYYNNTVISDGRGTCIDRGGDQFIAANNICYDVAQGGNNTTINQVWRNNLYYSVANIYDGPTPTEITNCGNTDGDTSCDVIFASVNNLPQGAALLPGSYDAIDKGWDGDTDIPDDDFEGTARPQGGAKDIGAFEHHDTSNAPPMPPGRLRVVQ